MIIVFCSKRVPLGGPKQTVPDLISYFLREKFKFQQ